MKTAICRRACVMVLSLGLFGCAEPTPPPAATSEAGNAASTAPSDAVAVTEAAPAAASQTAAPPAVANMAGNTPAVPPTSPAPATSLNNVPGPAAAPAAAAPTTLPNAATVRGLPGASNAGSTSGAASIEVRDSVVVCTFTQSGREIKLGTVENDMVVIYNSYGGGRLPLRDAYQLPAHLVGDGSGSQFSDVRAERLALRRAATELQLPGIWQLAEKSQGESKQAADPARPYYLVLRADHTFRVVQGGVKASGNWSLDADFNLLLAATGGATKSAAAGFETDGRLVLIGDEGRGRQEMYLVRTELTEEPR